MKEARTWRELLAEIVSNIQMKQRIMQELNISSLLLQRWLIGASGPSPSQMRQLLAILPNYRQQLLSLITKETEHRQQQHDVFSMERENLKIPALFYAHVLHSSTIVPENMRFWVLTSLIVQQAIGQLDPSHQGLAVRIVRCMPPRPDGKICSLLECYGQGTYPWKKNLEEQSVLLGVESLAGQVVITRKTVSVDSIDNQYHYTINGVDNLTYVGTTAYPIQRSQRIAGCVMISSRDPDHFTPSRQLLGQYYADLLALIFQSTDFYESHRIYLYRMPNPDEQKHYLPAFRRRVATLLREALQEKRHIDTHKAELHVWQQFETEFLAFSMPDDRHNN